MTAYSVIRVRRSLIYFSVGKGFGVVLGVSMLLTLVRALEVEAYSFYIITQALLPIIDSLSSLGLGAIAQRYLPELFSQLEGRRLSKLSGLLCVLRFLTLLVSVIMLYYFAEYLVEALSLSGMVLPLQLFLVVILFELFARYLDIIFDSLLLQGVSQISMLLRTGLRVIPVLWLLVSTGEPVALTTWIIIDAIAAIVGCIWGSIVLWHFMRKTLQENPGSDKSLEFKRYYRYSLPFYLASNISNISSQNVVKLIAAKILNTSQFASFGFSASLIAMLQRYLPMFLLINMIRPLFVSARQKSDYASRIPVLAVLVLKLNLFMLVPIIAILIVYSDSIANLLTGNRYPETGSYILAFLPILITQTIRNIAGLISQAMENSRAPLVATILSIFGLLFGVLLSKYIGVYGFCLGLLLSDIVFAMWVLQAVVTSQLVFSNNLLSYTKFLVLTMIIICLLYGLKYYTDAVSVISLLTSSSIIVFMYLFIAYIIRPFTQIERDIINKILNRKVFIW